MVKMSGKYAVIQINGGQYLVGEGDVVEVDRVENTNPRVLLSWDGKKMEVGKPALENVEVDLEKEGDFKDKMHIRRFKSKVRYRRKRGHNQPKSRIKIKSIGAPAKQKETSKKSKKEPKAKS